MQPDTDPIKRACEHAATTYADAEIRTKNFRGKPVVLAIEDNLIRLIRLSDLDMEAKRGRSKPQ
jgi:hypothetical protein